MWSQVQSHPNIAQCFPNNSQLCNIFKSSLSIISYLINYCTESPEITIQMIKQQELIVWRGAPTTNDKTSYTENPFDCSSSWFSAKSSSQACLVRFGIVRFAP